MWGVSLDMPWFSFELRKFRYSFKKIIQQWLLRQDDNLFSNCVAKLHYIYSISIIHNRELRALGKERRWYFATVKSLWYSHTLSLSAVLVSASQARCRGTRKCTNDPSHAEEDIRWYQQVTNFREYVSNGTSRNVASNIPNSVVVGPREQEWIAENGQVLPPSETKSCARQSFSLIQQDASHGLPIILESSSVTTTYLFSTIPIFFFFLWNIPNIEINIITLKLLSYWDYSLWILKWTTGNFLFHFIVYVFWWKFEFSTKNGLCIFVIIFFTSLHFR